MEKPCIVLRSETEWIETIEHGWNHLVDIFTENIAQQVDEFIPSGTPPNVFGKKVASAMTKIISNIK